MVDRRLLALHLVQPDHRPAVHGLRAQRRGDRAADPQPRHLRSRSARTPTTRTASTPSGAFRAAARSAAASPSSANACKSCTAPDDPNYVTATAGVFNGVALCDDFALDIPWRPQFKMSGTREVGYGINVSMSFQNNSSPTSSRIMTVTRGTTRYPANCPSPCPAGEIIMPTAVVRPDDDELHARVGAPVVGRTHRAARPQGRAHVPLRPRPGAADVRGVQPQQLGRDHQLQHHQRPVDDVPRAQQHHAGPHVWRSAS